MTLKGEKTRPWTEEDLATLHAEWGKTPRRELARRLGRGVHGCDKAYARSRQPRRTRRPPLYETLREVLTALHAGGMSDRQLAAALGRPVTTVFWMRARLRLACNDGRRVPQRAGHAAGVFLRARLADGPVPLAELRRAAAREGTGGLCWHTVRLAARRLGLLTLRPRSRHAAWALPDHQHPTGA